MSELELYGLLAEFDEPGALVHAARRTRQASFRNFDAFSPMPVEGLAEAVRLCAEPVE